MDVKQARHPTASLRPVTAMFLAALLASIVGCDGGRIATNPEDERGVKRSLTYLKLEPLTGRSSPINLKDLQGHVTLLNIWGTWCPPCRAELPHIAELRQRFAGQTAFRLVAVSYPSGSQGNDVESLREETADLLERLDLDLPTYYDPEGKTLDTIAAVTDVNVSRFSFPTTLLLDRHGVIRAIWKGYGQGVETEMERYIAVVLAEKE